MLSDKPVKSATTRYLIAGLSDKPVKSATARYSYWAATKWTLTFSNELGLSDKLVMLATARYSYWAATKWTLTFSNELGLSDKLVMLATYFLSSRDQSHYGLAVRPVMLVKATLHQPYNIMAIYETDPSQSV